MSNATELQLNIEKYYSRKHIDGYIEEEIKASPALMAKVHQGVALLVEWLKQDYYKSKNARLAQLDPMCLEELVLDVFTTIAYCQKPQLFVGVAGQMAHRMGFDRHEDSIKTVSEVIAVLCGTDAYDISKEDAYASLKIVSCIPLSNELQIMIERSTYLPPMVCPPDLVTNNYESPYLTHNESQILGRSNSHTGDICLDVINIQNHTALTLDKDFLNTVDEEPSYELDTAEKVQEWNTFLEQSREIYRLMIASGNQFYLTNRVDKRGRLYAMGYHVTTQGTPYKKASIELAKQEVVTGVPPQTK